MRGRCFICGSRDHRAQEHREQGDQRDEIVSDNEADGHDSDGHDSGGHDSDGHEFDDHESDDQENNDQEAHLDCNKNDVSDYDDMNETIIAREIIPDQGKPPKDNIKKRDTTKQQKDSKISPDIQSSRPQQPMTVLMNEKTPQEKSADKRKETTIPKSNTSKISTQEDRRMKMKKSDASTDQGQQSDKEPNKPKKNMGKYGCREI